MDLVIKTYVCINKNELEKFVSAYDNGKPWITINGEKIILDNPFLIKIFDCCRFEEHNSPSKVKNELKKIAYISSNDIITLNTLERLGENVTAEFIKGEWGEQAYKIDLPPTTKIKDLTGKIFISHSIKDKIIVEAFTDNILHVGLGVQPHLEIFNISIEDAGIKSGEDFKRRIESELRTAKAVIQIITENYKTSEACLNEMGAAWILEAPVIPFILDPISHNTFGFIHNTTQLLKLDSKSSLKQFVSENKGVLFSLEYNDTKLDRKIDEFLEILKSKSKSNSVTFKVHKIDPKLEDILKNQSEEILFYKIDNHLNIYYFSKGKFHEIPDELTLKFLGYQNKHEIINSNEDIQSSIGPPIVSILNSKLIQSINDDKLWLIRDNYRHHLDSTNFHTFHNALIATKRTLSVTVKADHEIFKYPQKDQINF